MLRKEDDHVLRRALGFENQGKEWRQKKGIWNMHVE